jgi:hypothetical protein
MDFLRNIIPTRNTFCFRCSFHFVPSRVFVPEFLRLIFYCWFNKIFLIITPILRITVVLSDLFLCLSFHHYRLHHHVGSFTPGSCCCRAGNIS